MIEITQKLSRIQSRIAVEKGQYNSFGGFHYRSCEDILKKLKPLLKEEGCILLLSDKVNLIGERYYIIATAKLICTETNQSLSVDSVAREPLSKKKMDDCQLSGAASSYARKYALNGLFLLDDGVDSDKLNNGKEEEKEEREELTYNDWQNIVNLGSECGYNQEETKKLVLEKAKELGISPRNKEIKKYFNNTAAFTNENTK